MTYDSFIFSSTHSTFVTGGSRATMNSILSSMYLWLCEGSNDTQRVFPPFVSMLCNRTPCHKDCDQSTMKMLSHCRSWQKFANFTFCLIIEEWLFKETCIVLKRHRSIYLSSQKLFIFKQEEYTCWGPITSLSMKKFKGIFN